MRIKKIKRENGTFRYQSIPHGASKTDQSDANMVNINTIMRNYAKTGLLPQFKEKIPQYIDATQIPSYLEAHAQITEAKELFSQLPSQIRKDMNNNPANLENYIKNPENHDLLLKYGILEKKKVDRNPSDDPTSDSASVKNPAKDESKKAE